MNCLVWVVQKKKSEKQREWQLKSFDAALAWIVADTDSRRTYRSLEFHKSSKFLILIGGDTGGRHFKFVFFSTHQLEEHANSGDNCNIWFMCEKFKETYCNLQQALFPETAKVIAELIREIKN